MKKLIIALCLSACSTGLSAQSLQPIAYADIAIGGELKTRAERNFERLEQPDYAPAKVFPTDRISAAEQWPGDIEGRVMLGLVLQAQANHRQPANFAAMLKLLPLRVNNKGYFGPLQRNIINEQQLSGNGWVLRALCEYYQWSKDQTAFDQIKKIITNLALPTRGLHKDYPIDPSVRKANVGAASGTTQGVAGRWMLSSDTGCDFIFMDGVVQAYELMPSPELKSLIEEMIARFLQMDLLAIRAQTHATLTGLRGVLRFYAITRQALLLQEVESRYAVYRQQAMTTNYENFNWFGRPEWTEPCGIVDSYLLAVQLWLYTGKPGYLEDAHHIYYNAIANTQRANGGFGLSNCPRPGLHSLKVELDEANWCCTMRGAEGLTAAVRYSYFVQGDTVVVPFYHQSEATVGTLKLKQLTEYPFEGKVCFEVAAAAQQKPITLKLFAPDWGSNYRLRLNNQTIGFKNAGGFLVFTHAFAMGDKLTLNFELKTEIKGQGPFTLNYGPLLLGYETTTSPELSFTKGPRLKKIAGQHWSIKGTAFQLSPVYHLLNPEVSKASGYAKQVLFNIKK